MITYGEQLVPICNGRSTTADLDFVDTKQQSSEIATDFTQLTDLLHSHSTPEGP